MPYPEKGCIAVALTTQTHHPGSIAVTSEAWIRGDPGKRSHVLPWTVTTLKDDLHVASTQDTVTEEFTNRVTAAHDLLPGRPSRSRERLEVTFSTFPRRRSLYAP